MLRKLKRAAAKNRQIRKLSEITGWGRAQAKASLQEGKEKGIPYGKYIENRCWELTEQEQVELGLYLRRFSKIKKLSGWEDDQIRTALEEAKEKGITMEQYVKNRCWELTEEGLDNLYSMIAAQQKLFDLVHENTGWPKEQIKRHLAAAKKVNINRSQYIRLRCWEFTEEELSEYSELLKAQKKKIQADREWYVHVVCEKTGWDEDHAVKMMNEARKKGYSYRDFITKALFRKTEKEILALKPLTVAKPVSPVNKTEQKEIRKVKPANKAKPKEIKPQVPAKKPQPVHQQTEKRKADTKPQVQKPISVPKAIPTVEQDNEKRRKKAALYRKLIMEEMGWSLGRVRLETLRANIECGATPVEFYVYKIYKNGTEAGRKFITEEINSKMKTRWCDWGGDVRTFRDKGRFNTEFKDFIHRTWFLSQNLTYDDFKKKVEGIEKIIYKPLNGIEGKGIETFTFDGTEETRRSIYDFIAAGQPAIIEEYIKQHDEINGFYPNAVNTIRVMSLYKDGECHILNAVIKFATKKNVDNMYQGGIAAGIDVENGIICTEGADNTGTLYRYHPYSNKEILGFEIPHWDKLVEAVKAAGLVRKQTPYVGWDIAITPDGVEFVEGNHNQGAYLIQYPFACYNLEGRRHTVAPYLEF